MKYADRVTHDLAFISGQLTIHVNDLSIYTCDRGFGHEPIAESHGLQIVYRKAHGH